MFRAIPALAGDNPGGQRAGSRGCQDSSQRGRTGESEMTEHIRFRFTHAGLSDFLQTWIDTLAQVLGEIRGTPLPCTMLVGKHQRHCPHPAEEDLWIVATLSGSLRGETSFPRVLFFHN